jgi:D-glycero-alpha-D-manno-heptose-7-phosphate kinase
MLITRTPLRITLGGGGTDLPSYYERFGGTVVAAAINKHIYIGINRTFTPDYSLKYSEQEKVGSVNEIRHSILREALRLHDIGPGIELVSLADIPSGTGLGSSGAFTVGVLRALHAFKREHVSMAAVAEEACKVEIEVLGRPVGKQDQYIGAVGGLTSFEFCSDGSVRVRPLRVPAEALRDLEERLLLFFTGYSRSADEVLADQKQRSQADDAEMLDSLHETMRNGESIATALESGDLDGFARLLNEHWDRKRRRSSGMTNSRIDELYAIGRANGAAGGKLVGAGGGGFLLFFAERPAALRGAMAREGVHELEFHFDYDGSVVLVRD